MATLPSAFMSIAESFNSAFGGSFIFDAEVITQGAIQYDDAGSVIPNSSTPSVRTCRIQCDEATTQMRQSPDFVQGDRRLIINTESLEGQVSTNDRIRILSGPFAALWLVHAVQNDPANIGHIIWGRRA